MLLKRCKIINLNDFCFVLSFLYFLCYYINYIILSSKLSQIYE